MKTTKLVLMTMALAVAGVACAAESDEVENVGSSGGSGGGYVPGGTGATPLGSGGGTMINPDYGTTIASTEGKLTGIIRDFPNHFPDYRPCDKLPGVKNCFEADDLGIVGAKLTSFLGPDMKPIYAGPPDGTITTFGASWSACGGKPCFDYWFRDVEGLNKKEEFTIQFVKHWDPTKAAQNIWIFNNNNQMLFPIDGKHWGNDDPAHPEHNYGYTFELHMTFKYETGQVFAFNGDDDVFAYINKVLVINIGGIHSPRADSIALDTLGLTAGQTYQLDFFFAERNPTFANFTIETSISTWEESILY